MVVIRFIEHKKCPKKGSYRWIYQGSKTKNITCPACLGKFDLSTTDRRIAKKVETMNRERG